ncbi:MAG: major capsid protein [Deltaproteobacteria bacterium]|nr:major capsid protein [Deltaproteobacteria bacterium]
MQRDNDLLRQPTLTDMIRDFDTDGGLKLVNAGILPEKSVVGQSITWDIERAQRDVAQFEGKHSKSTPRKLSVIGQRAANLARSFKSTQIAGSYLMDLRNPGTMDRQRIAQDEVGRETLQLRNVFDRQDEFMIAGAIQGLLNITIDGIAHSIDYGFAADHKFAPATPAANIPTLWSDPTADVIDDLTRILKRVALDSGAALSDAWTSRDVIAAILKNNAFLNYFGQTPAGAEAIRTGTISGFFGLNWHVYEGTYQNDGGPVTLHVPAEKIIFTPPARPENYMAVGTDVAKDGEALTEVQGLYEYSTVTDDPPGINLFAGKVRLPIIRRPDVFATASVL